ncbi:hypothetical protein [Jannaschia formosa]|uniref:hypothetical protein n=1 Tax=Jannaschia formosa TaxID=2259592 RepID=UPI000E1BB985|nr:hypothetical protein [Jannaschia formosa]TFL19082.1 hypothetical protein DR046_06625 [Jannaschia formosa]
MWRLLALLPLFACGMPHPMDGLVESGTATGNGYSYRVNWNRTEAQATRTNATWRPDLAEVTRGAILATEEVTGCAVLPGTTVGDVALLRMRLDCP